MTTSGKVANLLEEAIGSETNGINERLSTHVTKKPSDIASDPGFEWAQGEARAVEHMAKDLSKMLNKKKFSAASINKINNRISGMRGSLQDMEEIFNQYTGRR